VKRWATLFSILGIVTVVSVCAFHRVQPPVRQRAHFAQVRFGITEREVIDLMGMPDGQFEKPDRPSGGFGPWLQWISTWPPGTERVCFWRILGGDEYDAFLVFFDADGRVTGARLNPTGATP
jgi:hypothetical protein